MYCSSYNEGNYYPTAKGEVDPSDRPNKFMLKKLLALFLAVLLCLTAVACTTENANGTETDSSGEDTTESTTDSTTETESESESVTDDPGIGPDTSELLPAYEGSNLGIHFTDTNNDCTLMTVQGASKSDYESYVGKMLAYSNYETVVAPRDILGGTGNIASMYTKTTDQGVYLINVLWIPEENSIYELGEVKVTAEPLFDTDLSVFDPASETVGKAESLLIQIGLDEVKSDGSDANTVNGGMAYAYRLSDGSFFLIDGGGDGFGSGDMDKDNAARIYQTLKKYSVTEEIVIAGWYITHPHTDHMGAFMAFYADFS